MARKPKSARDHDEFPIPNFKASKQEAAKVDVEVQRTRLKSLINLGKERGFLTYAEINDHLPDMVDAEQIESITTTFNEMGIQVYDEAPDAETLLMTEAAPVSSDDDDAEEEATAALTTVDSEFGRTTDSACAASSSASSSVTVGAASVSNSVSASGATSYT